MSTFALVMGTATLASGFLAVCFMFYLILNIIK